MSAEIVTRIHIRCDRQTSIGPCVANREWAAADIESARNQAARAGWRHDDHGDFCPVHSPRPA